MTYLLIPFLILHVRVSTWHAYQDLTVTTVVKNHMTCLLILFLIRQLRQHVGEQLYMQILTHNVLVSPEGMDEAMIALSSTDWSSEIASIKPTRDELYAVFGVTRLEPAPQNQM